MAAAALALRPVILAYAGSGPGLPRMVPRMFRPRLFRSSYVLSALAAVLALACTAAVTRADLNGDLRAVLADKYLSKATVGVVVARLGDKPDDTQIIFRHNGTTPLIPASNLKVVTTAAALEQLGPDFKF